MAFDFLRGAAVGSPWAARLPRPLRHAAWTLRHLRCRTSPALLLQGPKVGLDEARSEALAAHRALLRSTVAVATAVSRVDVLLLPPVGISALWTGRDGVGLVGAFLVALFSLLDVPVGMMPVTLVAATASELSPASWGVGRDGRGGRPGALHRVASRAVAGAGGLPDGVQGAGRPWREKVVVRAMAEVGAAVVFNARLVALAGLAAEIGRAHV